MNVMILALLLQTATAPSAVSSMTAAAENRTDARFGDIVVTAHPLASTERALADCLARHCSPKEDIAASLAHAENQIVAGDYYGGRKTLLAARSRDARYADKMPEEVGALLRANARVASFVGMPDVSRINQIDSLDALKKGLPPGDARVLIQRMEVGDAFAKQGDITTAVSIYRRVSREARRRGLPIVEGTAMLREAVFYASIATIDSAYKENATEAQDRLLRTSDPALKPFRDAAGSIVAALDKTPPSGPADIPADARRSAPRLVHQSNIDNRPGAAILASSKFGKDDFIQWADVAFHISPEGLVQNVTVLRQSKPLDPRWLAPVRKALLNRRYTGYPSDAVPPGIDRTERYSFVHDVMGSTGSRIIGRSEIGRIDMLDLTLPSPAK